MQPEYLEEKWFQKRCWDAEVGRRKSEDKNTSGFILWRYRVRFWSNLTPTPDLNTSQILLIPQETVIIMSKNVPPLRFPETSKFEPLQQPSFQLSTYDWTTSVITLRSTWPVRILHRHYVKLIMNFNFI